MIRLCSILLVLQATCIRAQLVHPSLLPKYFYDNTDTLILGKQAPVKSDAALQSWMKKKGCIYIDSATFTMEKQNGYDTILNVTNSMFTYPFFVYQTEISNAEYKAFEQALAAKAYRPDSAVWNVGEEETHPFSLYYYQHKAYSNYPVVGVTHWQAEQYCKWITEKLNKELKDKEITEYTLVAALPSEAEWQAMYQKTVLDWLKQHYAKHKVFGTSYIDFVLGSNTYRCNFGKISSDRGARIKIITGGSSLTGGGVILTPTKSFTQTNGVYNLLGNVAEWTSTNAAGCLFNYEQYIYTTNDRIIPNYTTNTDKNKLAGILHDSATMSKYYAIKGGSWNQDVYFLEPAAMFFKAEWTSANNVGFRYVVRVYKK